MKIAFHTNQLSVRGTEHAIYDYADFNESLLANQSIIVTPKVAAGHNELAAKKFAARFNIYGYESLENLEQILSDKDINLLYCIKAGYNDNIFSRKVRTVIHSVFGYCEPHADVYAYVSEWLSMNASNMRYPWVPHIVRAMPETGDLRKELNIPENAIVFGRHGADNTFDIPFVHLVISSIIAKRNDIYFLFLGTNSFCEPNPQIIHLDPSLDPDYKSKFISTCDAMLHGRMSGETFGLAISEFSALNKPVITYSESAERAHIDILADNALYYNDAESLTRLLWLFEPNPGGYWKTYLDRFTPQSVMQKFHDVFLAD